MTRYRKIIVCIIFLTTFAGTHSLSAQQPVSSDNDTLKRVDILNYTRQLTLKTIDDSTQLTIIAGNVKLKQGNSVFYCDSCVVNNNTNVFEAWGKVHINDSDTTDIYSNHLRYLIKKKQAFLDGGVKLTDGKSTLTTPDLEYNMETNLGIYKKGGKLITNDNKTTLTSQEGWYFSDLKDAYFKKNVVLKDPAYTIVTDSILYNKETKTSRFISMTTITDSSGRIVKTREGYYNQQTGKAEFGQRPEIIDGKVNIKADRFESDDSTGISVATGNAVIVDSAQGTTIIAGIIYRNKETGAILATRKPLMIIKQDNDSIYITADTLFSAKLTDLYLLRESMETPDSSADSISVTDSITIKKKPADSLASQGIAIDTLNAKQNISRDQTKDTVMKKYVTKQTITSPKPGGLNSSKDSVWVQTTKGLKVVALNEKDSTNRYFEAYRHVRIFNDSLQAVCDSLFYSFKDSVFRLYYEPVVWSKENQITGDTVLLFTKNKKADKIQAFENSFLANKLDVQAYNQIKATRMDGFFIDGNIDSVRARGFAECIYYVQDEDSAYTGINQAKCDVMDVYFKDKEVNKVVFRSSVTGTLWPIRQKSPSEMRLQNFKWLDERRPKTRLEMYE